MDQEEPESNTYDDIDTYEFDDNVSLASSVSTTRSNLSPVIDKSIAKEWGNTFLQDWFNTTFIYDYTVIDYLFHKMLNMSKQQGLLCDIFPLKSAKSVHFQKPRRSLSFYNYFDKVLLGLVLN